MNASAVQPDAQVYQVVTVAVYTRCFNVVKLQT